LVKIEGKCGFPALKIGITDDNIRVRVLEHCVTKYKKERYLHG